MDPDTGKKKRVPNPEYDPTSLKSSSPNGTSPNNGVNASQPLNLDSNAVADRWSADQQDNRPVRGEKECRVFLLQSLGVTSLLLAMIVCYLASAPMALAEELALTPEEVEAFATPGARLLAKSKIPANVKSSLVNSGDYIGLGTAVIAYVYRILSVLKENNPNVENAGQATRLSAAGPTSNGVYTSNNITSGAGALAGWGNFTAG